MYPQVVKLACIAALLFSATLTVTGIAVIMKSLFALRQRVPLFKVHDAFRDKPLDQLVRRQFAIALTMGILTVAGGCLSIAALLMDEFVQASLAGAP